MAEHGGSRPRSRVFVKEEIVATVLLFPWAEATRERISRELGIANSTAGAYLRELVEEGIAYRELRPDGYVGFVIYPAHDPRSWGVESYRQDWLAQKTPEQIDTKKRKIRW